jgi:hypothetical protein
MNYAGLEFTLRPLQDLCALCGLILKKLNRKGR